jgi:cellulose synthase/poly-beta-1,6-N-acetylglucosamine synthase-like glycosyltransferase
LDSLLAQDYAGVLGVVVVSDMSTDRTHEIARSYQERGVRLWQAPRRQGKAANFSAVVPTLKTDLVICTDAGGVFAPDVVSCLARHFDNPRTGLVGARVVYGNVGDSAVSQGEGLYWRYEVLLRTLETRLGGTVIVSGACYAIRRRLFRPVHSGLPDDFMSPLNVWDQGHTVHYEPRATIRETVATTVEGGFRTKVRIVSRNVTALWKMRHLMNPFRRPFLAVKLLSHRFLRWLAGPFLLLVLLLNIALLPGKLYAVLFGIQAGCYLLALLGLLPTLRRLKVISTPFYFVLVNTAAAVGIWHALRGRISGVWDPEERASHE